MKAIDITGQKFGRLMALNLDCSEPKKKERRWICVCECGQKKSINQHKLTRGNTKSCGCLIQKKNILGEMFGKLLAIRPEETSISSRKPKWICRCECGKIKTVSRSNLVSGHTKSCGCLFGNYDEKISEKFFIKENGCWEWISGVGGNGYGIISIEGKSKSAHRAVYEMFVQEINKRLLVCHICDNKLCVCPDHLYLGTHKQNTKDAIDRGLLRHDLKISPKGESHVFSKLTEKDVLEIRKKYIPKVYSQRKLANEFGISYSNIQRILKRKAWKHI